MSATPADDLYLAVIDDRRRRPRRRGALPEANRGARRENPACGDWCALALAIETGPGGVERIVAARQTGAGCALSQASADLAATTLEGRTPAEALALIARIEALLDGDAPGADETDTLGDAGALAAARARPERRACARVAWTAARAALARAG